MASDLPPPRDRPPIVAPAQNPSVISAGGAQAQIIQRFGATLNKLSPPGYRLDDQLKRRYGIDKKDIVGLPTPSQTTRSAPLINGSPNLNVPGDMIDWLSGQTSDQLNSFGKGRVHSSDLPVSPHTPAHHVHNASTAKPHAGPSGP